MKIIGTAYLYYHVDGAFFSAEFQPAAITLGEQLTDQLKTMQGDCTEDTMKTQAQHIVAEYFKQNNDIELADRDKYEIVAELSSCEKWPNGNIKRAGIRFTLKKRKKNAQNSTAVD